MKDPIFLKAKSKLIRISDVREVDAKNFRETGLITLITEDGRCYDMSDIDAIEALMLLKPSITEGLCLSWQKGRWAFHNIIGHPGMQILVWLGFKKAAIAWHDCTVPHLTKRSG